MRLFVLSLVVAWFMLASEATWHSQLRRCCKDTTLKIGLIHFASHTQPTKFNGVAMTENDPPDTAGSYSGYLPDLIDALSQEMAFSYRLITSTGVTQSVNKDGLLALSNGTLDMVPIWGDDIHIDVDALHELAFTYPVVTFTHMCLVHKEKEPQDGFSFFRPFALQTWVILIGLLLLLMLVQTILSSLQPSSYLNEFAKAHPYVCVQTAYDMLTAGLGKDERYMWWTGPMQLHRLGILFLSLIFLSTYTASLAAAFMTPKVIIHGPKNMDELKESKVYYTAPTYKHVVEQFAKKVEIHPKGTNASIEEIESLGLVMLRNHSVDAVISANTGIANLAVQNCRDTHIVPGISFAPYYLGMAMRADASSRLFANQFNMAFAAFTPSDTFNLLTRRNMFVSTTTCSEVTGEDGADAVANMGVEAVWGAIVIYGIVAVSAIVAALGLSRRGCNLQERVDRVIPSALVQEEMREAETEDIVQRPCHEQRDDDTPQSQTPIQKRKDQLEEHLISVGDLSPGHAEVTSASPRRIQQRAPPQEKQRQFSEQHQLVAHSPFEMGSAKPLGDGSPPYFHDKRHFRPLRWLEQPARKAPFGSQPPPSPLPMGAVWHGTE